MRIVTGTALMCDIEEKMEVASVKCLDLLASFRFHPTMFTVAPEDQRLQALRATDPEERLVPHTKWSMLHVSTKLNNMSRRMGQEPACRPKLPVYVKKQTKMAYQRPMALFLSAWFSDVSDRPQLLTDRGKSRTGCANALREKRKRRPRAVSRR